MFAYSISNLFKRELLFKNAQNCNAVCMPTWFDENFFLWLAYLITLTSISADRQAIHNNNELFFLFNWAEHSVAKWIIDGLMTLRRLVLAREPQQPLGYATEWLRSFEFRCWCFVDRHIFTFIPTKPSMLHCWTLKLWCDSETILE